MDALPDGQSRKDEELGPQRAGRLQQPLGGFFKWGIPKSIISILNGLSMSNDLDDLGNFGNFHLRTSGHRTLRWSRWDASVDRALAAVSCPLDIKVSLAV